MTYYNRNEDKEKRARLRNQMPAPEVVLWSRLKNRQLLGKKFRRQFGVGVYAVDFYCPELKLAIEIDVESHFVGSGPAHDTGKERVLAQSGIAVVRVNNYDVMRSLDAVLELIASTILERQKALPAYPPAPAHTLKRKQGP